MTATLRPAVPDDFLAYYGETIEATALEIDGEVVAICAVMRRDERLWATLDIRGGHTLSIVRAIQDGLKRHSPVYVECQSAFPTAERLLRIIGFTPTDERRRGMGVWRYG